MPDINVNVLDQQNTVNVSAGVYPTLLVDVDHEENTVNVTVEKQTPVVDVQISGRGPTGPQGIQGPPGADGADGQDGAPGADGADGVSPVISSESITGGHRLTIVDAGGTTTVDVMDGQDGQDGTNGTNGTDGQDGVSPGVTIASITGGHSVTITDADHPGGQSFNVMDGQDGQNGQDGADGVGVPASGSTGQVLAKKSGTDYDTEWVTPSTGSIDIFWCTYGSTASAEIETALAANQLPCVIRDDVVYVYAFKTSATKHYFGSTGLKTQQYLYIVEDNGTWAHNYIDIRSIPSGGNAGQLLAKNSASDYDVHWVNKTQDYPSAYCTTAAGTAAKKASCSLWTATANSYLHVLIGQANTNAGAITLNVNSTGAKPIYINGEASSATNYTLPAGSYLVFYDGTNFYFRTDGKLTADITGTAGNGVPSGGTQGQVLMKSSSTTDYETEWTSDYVPATVQQTNVTLSKKNTAAWLIKQGSFVFLTSNHDFTSLPHGSTVLGTIPAGFRPESLLRVPIANNLSSKGLFIEINYSGQISVYWDGTAINSATNGAFSAFYYSVH